MALRIEEAVQWKVNAAALEAEAKARTEDVAYLRQEIERIISKSADHP
jgi:hypothetical protein